MIKCKPILGICWLLWLLPSLLCAENRLSSPSDKLYLDNAVIKESEREVGAYISGDTEALGFLPFDWKQLPVSGAVFKSRMFTIRSIFSIDPSLSDEEIAIYLGPAYYSYNVYLNGELLARRGDITPGSDRFVHNTAFALLPPKLLNASGENEVAIQLFSGPEMTKIGGIYIGLLSLVEPSVFMRNMLVTDFCKIAVFLAFLLFLYFLYLFFNQAIRERRYIYFSMVCLAFAVAYTNLGFYFDFSNSLFWEKLSRIGLPLASGFYTLFLIVFTGVLDRFKFVKWLLIMPCILSAIMTTLGRDKVAVQDFFSSITTNAVITPLLVFNLVIILISIIRDKNRESLILLLGTLGILVGGLWDMGFINNHEIPDFWGVPFGYCVMILCIFMILARKQGAIQRELINRQEALNRKNEALSSIFSQIGKVSESLSGSSVQLDIIIMEAVDMVKNYEQDNKALMENALSRFSSIDSLVDGIKERLIESTTRMPKAVAVQTESVTNITGSISAMNKKISSTADSAGETDRVAGDLATLAEESSDVIQRSKSFSRQIAEYSEFIGDVLASIEDVTERTKILSINAAIEAARSGHSGKGFAVVASEIRKLALQSQSSLESSFGKMKEMQSTIIMNAELSDRVEESLSKIISGAKQTASRINHINRLILSQEEDSSAILSGVRKVAEGTQVIKELAQKDISNNSLVSSSLSDLRKTLSAISNQLKEQMDKGTALQKLLSDISRVMDENRNNVNILNECMESNL